MKLRNKLSRRLAAFLLCAVVTVGALTMAAGAAAEVEGISGLMNLATKKTAARGVRLSLVDNAAVIDLYVMVRYGYPIPEVAEKIQNAVSSAVEAMTGFQVKAVNVHVGGVSFQ